MKNKKIIIVIVMVLITILLEVKVKAGEKDSSLIKNRIEGIYAVAPLSDKTHLYYLQKYTLNGITSYCIELGKDITTDIYNSTENTSEQLQLTKLSEEKLNYIKAIAYFGYGYNNHNDIEYYMAAQELIWEYLNNIDITWTNEQNINGVKINIDSYKNEIENMAKRYIRPLSLPNFETYSIDSINTIIDQNNSIEFYNVSSKNNNEVIIQENKLIIKLGSNEVKKDSIILTRKNDFNNKSRIYYFNNSQIMLSQGNLDKLTHEITVNVKGAKLTLNVIDKDTNTYSSLGQASLDGVTYTIYNNERSYNLKINYPGSSIIVNIPYGTYYIKQTKTGNGYKKNNEIKEITINKLNNNITMIEEIIKNTIEINKLYEFENSNIREENITFNIFDNNNKLYESITTTRTGPDIVSLPFGTYTIKQENTTYGYEKVNDIILNINEDNNTTIKYTLLDKKIKSKINITTINKDSNEQIEEANIEYRILDKNKNEYISYIDKENNTTNIITTNEEGNIFIPIELPYGEYVLEQITPPKKYMKSNEKIDFTINDKTEYSYINDEIVANINYYNKEIKGIINIKTEKEIIKEKDNNLIKKKESEGNVEIELYQNDKLISSNKTNNSGELSIKDLLLGEYCVLSKETQQKQCIKLESKDNLKETIETLLIFKKEINTTTLIIKNIDNQNMPISNTNIELYQGNNKLISNTTNKDGMIKIDNITRGNYCIKEIKINEQFVIDSIPTCFEINDTNKIKNIVITNQRKTKIIQVPNTLSNKKRLTPIMIPLAILIIIIINKLIKK